MDSRCANYPLYLSIITFIVRPLPLFFYVFVRMIYLLLSFFFVIYHRVFLLLQIVVVWWSVSFYTGGESLITATIGNKRKIIKRDFNSDLFASLTVNDSIKTSVGVLETPPNEASGAMIHTKITKQSKLSFLN